MNLKMILIYVAILIALPSASQQFLSEVGRVTTQFDYKDSEGNNPLEFFPRAGNHYQFAYRMNLGKVLHASAGLIYNRHITEGSDPLYNNKYRWDVEYAGLGVGMDLEFYKAKGFSLLGRAAIEPQFFIKGSQTINQQIHSLKKVEQFENPFVFFKAGLGMTYCADPRMAVSIKYQLGQGRAFGTSSDSEKLRLMTHTISVGLLWNFRRCRYCTRRSFH